MATEALARNYEMYRRQVLDRLGVQYYDEDIEEFDRWRLKVLQGLKDLYGEENIINAINAWLDEHTINFSGATASEEGEAGLVPPTTLGAKRQARAHYHLNAEGDWVVDPVWNAYGSGYGGTEKIIIKYPNSTGTAGVNIEAIGTGQKGTANGVATLGADGKVPSEQMRDIPLASGTTVGGIKFEMAGDPPRPSARLTTNWTPSYPNVADVKFPLIRDDGTISAYYIPDATQTVKGAMTAEDKTKLDGIKLEKIYRGGGSPSNPFVALEHDALSGANYGGSDFTNGTITWLPYLVQDSSSNEYLKIPKRFLPEYKREVIKTVTDSENLHNTTRGVYIWFDGDVIPDVNVYYEMTTTGAGGSTSVYAFKYDIVQVYRNITNDHPEYGSNKVHLLIYPNRFDSSTEIQAGGSFVVEHNGNKAEGGNIVH